MKVANQGSDRSLHLVISSASSQSPCSSRLSLLSLSSVKNCASRRFQSHDASHNSRCHPTAQGPVPAHTTRDPGQVLSSPRSRQGGKVGVLRISPGERGESGRFLSSDHPGNLLLGCRNRISLTGPAAKQRDFKTNYASIPPHGRWRHIDAGLPRVGPLLEQWRSSQDPPSDKEITKRLIDLFLVSVLLDAGAGNVWSYTETSSGQKFARSEGLGVASVHMFTEGLFSGDPNQPYRVDGQLATPLTWIHAGN